ncbi:hypothetical protein J6590_019108 [Homalodisca vitripennis]|nr:hypothetical protein J6590_019108 [Homalodisca vitripennis]
MHVNSGSTKANHVEGKNSTGPSSAPQRTPPSLYLGATYCSEQPENFTGFSENARYCLTSASLPQIKPLQTGLRRIAKTRLPTSQSRPGLGQWGGDERSPPALEMECSALVTPNSPEKLLVNSC